MSSTKIVRTEKRVRGVFGQVVKWSFIIFNILMVVWLVSGLSAIGHVVSDSTSEAQKAGAAIGGTIGVGLILFLWALGDIILGIGVMLTRGKKIITEESVA